MQIFPEQLSNHTAQRALPSCILVYGNEQVLVDEARELVKQKALAEGFQYAQWQVNAQFDWVQLEENLAHRDLFSEKRFIELVILQEQINQKGAECLKKYLLQTQNEDCLLITGHQLNTKAKASEWYKLLDKSGWIVPCWSLQDKRLHQWCHEKLKKAGLTLQREEQIRLMEAYEGNLFALRQAIEKLALCFPKQVISSEQLSEVITNGSRFDVFQLMDITLAGKKEKVVQVLNYLEKEGVEPAIILWAITRDIRLFVNLFVIMKSGVTIAQAFAKERIFPKRQALINSAMQRHKNILFWERLLAKAAQIDWIIKGVAPGNVWDELLSLCLTISLEKQ